MMESSSAVRSFPTSDLDDDRALAHQHHDQIQNLLETVGDYLHKADQELAQLEREDILGSAILRGCQELASAAQELADQLDAQTEEQRRALAQACLADAEHSLQLYNNLGDEEEMTTTISKDMQENEMMKVLQLASELLQDVAAALQGIEKDDAEELADVGLTVAQLFVASLQHLHATITPEQILDAIASNHPNDAACSSRSRGLQESPNIERLDHDDDDDNNNNTESPEQTKSNNKTSSSQSKRVRVLWPPLGPAVHQAMEWGKLEAHKNPLLAVALGLTLWPMAVVTTVVGTPLVLADGFLQDLYSNFSDAPLLVGMEQSAAQVYQTGKLSFVCSKLVAKQTLRIVQRQVDRHGGPQQIVQSVGAMALDRVLHPVDTIGMAWNGLCFGVGAVKDFVEHLQDSERQENVQLLQQ